MSSGKLLLGLLAGIAAGATLGILFAPDKGETTRRKITQKGDDYVEGLKEKFNDLVEGLTKQYDTAKEKTMRMMENGKAKADELVAEATAASKSKLQ